MKKYLSNNIYELASGSKSKLARSKTSFFSVLLYVGFNQVWPRFRVGLFKLKQNKPFS